MCYVADIKPLKEQTTHSDKARRVSLARPLSLDIRQSHDTKSHEIDTAESLVGESQESLAEA